MSLESDCMRSQCAKGVRIGQKIFCLSIQELHLKVLCFLYRAGREPEHIALAQRRAGKIGLSLTNVKVRVEVKHDYTITGELCVQCGQLTL